MPHDEPELPEELADAELREGFDWSEIEDEPRARWWRLVITVVVFGVIVGMLLGIGGMVMIAFL